MFRIIIVLELKVNLFIKELKILTKLKTNY
jgi:hypothetical protein